MEVSVCEVEWEGGVWYVNRWGVFLYVAYGAVVVWCWWFEIVSSSVRMVVDM